MNTDNISVNTQSSIRLNLNKVVYFDPYEIKEKYNDADIIFITHDHYDHFDINSINNVKNDNTIVITPASMIDKVSNIPFKDYIYLNPGDETNIDGINIKAIPSYNTNKSFHPKSNNWLGYIIEFNNVKYYIAGDTDITDENKQVKCDVAFLPCGGTYTMDYSEASELTKVINPKVLIPIHYGSIVGSKDEGLKIKELLSDTSIEVVEKIKF